MSEEETPDTHLPKKGAEIEWLVYQLSATFLPQIRLSRRDGLLFATDLSEYVESDSIKIDSNQWVLGCSSGIDRSEVKVTGSELQLKVVRPLNNPEWYEARYRFMLEAFGKRFKPEVLMQSRAMVRGLLPVDGDSRVFIGGRLLSISPGRIMQPMKRPLHGIGLRLFFPPYEEKDESNNTVSETDWGVDIKVESWVADPAKLYLEADARWSSPEPWGSESVAASIDRLRTVLAFVKGQLLEFLADRPPDIGHDQIEGDSHD